MSGSLVCAHAGQGRPALCRDQTVTLEPQTPMRNDLPDGTGASDGNAHLDETEATVAS